MLTIALATENPNKVREIQNALGAFVKIRSMAEVGFLGKLPPETGATYEENALIKARTLAEATGALSFGDDSGFEVHAMNNAPGLFSARFMGTHDSRLQCLEILKRIKNAQDRSAKFICVLAVVDPQKSVEQIIRAEVEGVVSESVVGDLGFGYDPIFIPKGLDKTFGEMQEVEKMKISHRGKALRDLKAYLEADERSRSVTRSSSTEDLS